MLKSNQQIESSSTYLSRQLKEMKNTGEKIYHWTLFQCDFHIYPIGCLKTPSEKNFEMIFLSVIKYLIELKLFQLYLILHYNMMLIQSG